MLDTCPLPPGAAVWGYLRDSGGDYQERSVAQQRAALERYAADHHLRLEAVYADEAKPGGTTESRDALDRLLADLRGRFPRLSARSTQRPDGGLVVWSLSRLVRNQDEATFILSDLRLRGLTLIALADDGLLTGHQQVDRLVEQLIFFKDEMYLESLSRDVRRGLHSLVQMRDTDPGFLHHHPDHQPTGRYLGLFPSSVPPRGFTVEEIAIGQRRDGTLRTGRRLVPHPTQAEQVQLAWRLRVVEQRTYRQIHEQVPLYSKSEHYATMFPNRIYIGEMAYGDQVYGSVDDPFVEPLIPREWWEKEAERRAARAARRRKGGKRQLAVDEPRTVAGGRLLSGLLVCGHCAGPFWATSMPSGGRTVAYYECGTAKRTDRCTARKVRAAVVERAVMSSLLTDVLTPDALREHLADLVAAVDDRRRQAQTEIRALRKQIAASERRAANLVDALAQRPASPSLLTRLDEEEAAQRDLAEGIRHKQANLALWGEVILSDADVQTFIQRTLADLENADPPRARRIMRSLFARIEVFTGDALELRLHYTFPRRSPDGLDYLPVPLTVEAITVAT